ncbi:MAG: S41 family peptidase [Thermoanaerobaculia bacterium]
MRPRWRLTASVLFALTLLVASLFGDRLLALNHEAREVLRLYTELLKVSHETYGGETSYKDLVNASIEGMVRSLDPHTSFLTAEAYSQMRDRQQSSFFGLGILVGLRNGQITVITPIEGTPASRMGLRAGDVIAAIEGETTEGMNINEAVRQLKGPKGTGVTITISRPGLDEHIEVTIVRDEIPQVSVRYQYMVSPETGYISISDFNRGTAREVREAVQALREQGMKQLLVDLRTNGGGLLDQAIEVVQQFLPKGSKIVETRGRTRDSHQEYFSEDPAPALDLPMVVLVGEGTASAAEIFAGAIQDHDVGLIVGTQTWGKGLVQTVYSLSYGAGLALTTARYYTPSGRLIQRDYSSWFDYSTHSNGVDPAEFETENSDAIVDIEAYRTDLGRKVYGGGGITPDVTIEPQEIPTLLQLLLSRNAFFDFAVSYANRHPIESREWQIPDPVLDEFYSWAVDEELITREELTEETADAAVVEEVRRNLRGELLNSAFGIEARYEILAEGDPQILEALSLFEDAKSLLARRQLLIDDSSQPEKTASLPE